jgi:hypothetical protein
MVVIPKARVFTSGSRDLPGHTVLDREIPPSAWRTAPLGMTPQKKNRKSFYGFVFSSY